MKIKASLILLASLYAFNSCSQETESGEVDKTTISEEDGMNSPVEVPFVEGYLEDWEGIKGSLLLQDADSVGTWGTMYGLNAEELVDIVADKKITEKLKATDYEDLIPDPKGETNYLRFEAENSGGGKLKVYIVATPYTLMIDYYIFKP